jgi:hypothetical protein
MPFCTLLEWDHDLDLARYEAMNERAGGHDPLPNGCLCRVVGPVETGARILEVWESADHARRFAEANGHLVAEFQLPPPLGGVRDHCLPGQGHLRLASDRLAASRSPPPPAPGDRSPHSRPHPLLTVTHQVTVIEFSYRPIRASRLERTPVHLSPFGLPPRLRRSRGGQFCVQVGLNRLEDTVRDVIGELVEPAPGQLRQLVSICHLGGSPDDAAREIHHVAAGSGMNSVTEDRSRGHPETDLL